MIAEEQRSDLFPDGDDAESVVYGSAFLFWKSTKTYWDQVIEHLNARAEKVFSQIRDIDFALNIVQTNPYAIDDEHSTGFDVDQSKDLRRMREFLNIRKAVYLADIKRTENEQYASLIGLSEYAEKRRLGGISDRLWKAATSRHSSSLDYETIRSKKDRDDKLIERESFLMKRKIDQYYRMRDMLERQPMSVEDEDVQDEIQEDVPEEDIELTILKEIESDYPIVAEESTETDDDISDSEPSSDFIPDEITIDVDDILAEQQSIAEGQFDDFELIVAEEPQVAVEQEDAQEHTDAKEQNISEQQFDASEQDIDELQSIAEVQYDDFELIVAEEPTISEEQQSDTEQPIAEEQQSDEEQTIAEEPPVAEKQQIAEEQADAKSNADGDATASEQNISQTSTENDT